MMMKPPLSATHVTTISRTELVHLLATRTDYKLVEALPPKYFEEAHLPTALNLPLDQLAALAPTLLPDQSELVITYCASTACENSAVAARELVALGYTNVHEYVEGKADWMVANLPVETSDEKQK